MKTVEKTDFRDKITTVDQSGKRVWLYPKMPKGKFTNCRHVVNSILLILLFAGPFIRINEQPVLMLNILERKFIIFGQIFWPQDFYLFGLAMIVIVVFVVLFTVVYGRIFCGWICPQTIFMEGVFRRIEYWIEGDWTARKKLDKQEWNAEKVWKKGIKHLIFLLISFLISNTFLAYIIGSEELLKIITEPPTEHLSGFIAILAFTGAFYGVFAFFREQVCTNVCPYGRLQGVLLDKKSIVVAYDYKRGENRGKFRKNEDRQASLKGDCVDCSLCVSVCPTGIDIRNGTQLECINCTACIDACDSIMDNVGLAKGLIRYDSEENIAEGKSGFHWNVRSIAYTVVLIVISTLLTGLLFIRTEIDATILRTPGMMPQSHEDGRVSNLYNYKIINKTNKEMILEMESLTGVSNLVGKKQITLPAQGTAEGALFIYMDEGEMSGLSQQVVLQITEAGRPLKKVKTKFIGR
ncbi:cytochrome c oxidase accessory protein CcoG [Litoribacter ruber]|uniref:cytochrome c oxidase accessory protein CcoG n=1 Tax=Litoribacter ruber TaxID=702568 RepID=UPI001BD95FD9|nr:cytochrome c oxidase accessory protein CcoG [Litoribacter ruber]MBT0810542.1 cytochrome c oxidase accessory protein CcoG [Litoribacter ruber]